MEKLILRARKEPARGKLKGHTSEIGKRYVLLDSKNYPRGRLYMIVRAVKRIRSGKRHLKNHVHGVDSVMTFIGDRDDLTGLKVEVTLADKRRVVTSPVSVYVPKGLRHGFRFLRGSGKYFNVVLVAGGNYNSVTKQ